MRERTRRDTWWIAEGGGRARSPAANWFWDHSSAVMGGLTLSRNIQQVAVKSDLGLVELPLTYNNWAHSKGRSSLKASEHVKSPFKVWDKIGISDSGKVKSDFHSITPSDYSDCALEQGTLLSSSPAQALKGQQNKKLTLCNFSSLMKVIHQTTCKLDRISFLFQ